MISDVVKTIKIMTDNIKMIFLESLYNSGIIYLKKNSIANKANETKINCPKICLDLIFGDVNCFSYSFL